MLINIKEDSLIQCQWCGKNSEASEWNLNTFNQCYTREMRRAFKPVYNLKVWGRDSKNFYKCPKCGVWSRGNQLILLKDDGGTAENIGRNPVMKILTNKDE